MAMRRKEKVLTIEEVKAKIIDQSTEKWLHSEPLLGIAAFSDGLKMIPLHSISEQGTLLLFMIDLGDYNVELVLEVLAQWMNEYKGLPWKPVIVFQPKYLFLKSSKFLDRFRSHQVFNSIPIFTDPLGEWFDYFGNSKESGLVIFHQGNVVFKENFGNQFHAKMKAAEKQFQDILRVDDPGLPLFEITDTITKKKPDLKKIELENLIQGGTWIQANDSLVTEDSNASLQFQFEGQCLRLLAITHPQARENTRFLIYLNDEPLSSVHYGKSTHQGDRGSAFSEINKSSGIFELIDADTPIKGKVTLKFLNTLQNPVIIYSLRSA